MGTMLDDNADLDNDESGDKPRVRKKYERKKEEPISCPTCGETMSQASLLAAHLASFPFDHGPTDKCALLFAPLNHVFVKHERITYSTGCVQGVLGCFVTK